MKSVVLLGASGNIGSQSLELLKLDKSNFKVKAISVGKNLTNIEKILNEFDQIECVYMIEKNIHLEKKFKNIKFIYSDITELINYGDVVINALSGFVGLVSTINAIQNSKTLLLANKESLFIAGSIIKKLLIEFSDSILLPIDSEHSAIFQCLENHNSINKIYLTASGGPFKNLSLEEIKDVKYDDVFKHPTWNMGKKITVDSATMMNKCLEIGECFWLFNTKKIEVLIHPQSIIHSMVEFNDFSIKAQLSKPDMKQVIGYALNYPNRKKYDLFSQIDFEKMINLELIKIDQKRFKPISWAFEAIDFNSVAIALNASNEVCVQHFIDKKINFNNITDIVEAIFIDIERKNFDNVDEIIDFHNKIIKLTIKKIEELV